MALSHQSLTVVPLPDFRKSGNASPRQHSDANTVLQCATVAWNDEKPTGCAGPSLRQLLPALGSKSFLPPPDLQENRNDTVLPWVTTSGTGDLPPIPAPFFHQLLPALGSKRPVPPLVFREHRHVSPWQHASATAPLHWATAAQTCDLPPGAAAPLLRKLLPAFGSKGVDAMPQNPLKASLGCFFLDICVLQKPLVVPISGGSWFPAALKRLEAEGLPLRVLQQLIGSTWFVDGLVLETTRGSTDLAGATVRVNTPCLLGGAPKEKGYAAMTFDELRAACSGTPVSYWHGSGSSRRKKSRAELQADLEKWEQKKNADRDNKASRICSDTCGH